MTHDASPTSEMTAKQRLAVSRQLLATSVKEPLWVSLARFYIRRGLKALEAKKQSSQVASGRTPS